MEINNESIIFLPLPSFILMKNIPQIAQFHVSQFSRKSSLGRYLCVFVYVVYSMCLCISICVIVSCEQSAQGSMRKANSFSECRLLRVRRSGRRRRSFGKRAVSSGRWRVISDRRARIRPSCSCSTACMSAMPERSEEYSGCPCECLTDTAIHTLTKCDCSVDFVIKQCPFLTC